MSQLEFDEKVERFRLVMSAEEQSEMKRLDRDFSILRLGGQCVPGSVAVDTCRYYLEGLLRATVTVTLTNEDELAQFELFRGRLQTFTGGLVGVVSPQINAWNVYSVFVRKLSRPQPGQAAGSTTIDIELEEATWVPATEATA